MEIVCLTHANPYDKRIQLTSLTPLGIRMTVTRGISSLLSGRPCQKTQSSATIHTENRSHRIQALNLGLLGLVRWVTRPRDARITSAHPTVMINAHDSLPFTVPGWACCWLYA